MSKKAAISTQTSNAFLARMAMLHIDCATNERKVGDLESLNRARVHVAHAQRIINKLRERGVAP